MAEDLLHNLPIDPVDQFLFTAASLRADCSVPAITPRDQPEIARAGGSDSTVGTNTTNAGVGSLSDPPMLSSMHRMSSPQQPVQHSTVPIRNATYNNQRVDLSGHGAVEPLKADAWEFERPKNGERGRHRSSSDPATRRRQGAVALRKAKRSLKQLYRTSGDRDQR